MAYGILAFANLLRMERPPCPPSVGVSRFTTPLQSPWLGRCFPDAALQYFAVLPWFVRGSKLEHGLLAAVGIVFVVVEEFEFVLNKQIMRRIVVKVACEIGYPIPVL